MTDPSRGGRAKLIDCRRFRNTEPCTPHKESRARCTTCDHYDPVEERILIVKLGAMGDVLRTTSCLGPLKERYPRSHVTWVTRANARPLLNGNPGIDRVLTIEENYLELIMSEEFDLAIGPDADQLSASIMRLARAGEKRGFVADGRGGIRPMNETARVWWLTGTDDGLKQANRRTYGEWLSAICELVPATAPPVLYVPDASHRYVAEFLAQRTSEAGPRICINTGASTRWKEKRWKASHYLGMARLLTDVAADTSMILIGGPEERAFNQKLLSEFPGFVDFGTDQSVEHVGAMMAACDWVLTPDSLGYHIACAVGTPAVCLVGPTAPWELDQYGRNLVLYSQLPCIGCYRPTCPHDVSCMDLLTPAIVWSALEARAATGPSAYPFRSGIAGLPVLRSDYGHVGDRSRPSLPILTSGSNWVLT